jgi:hypothetical protein
MSSLVSQNEKNYVINTFSGIFDTWSREIIVFKEPIKTAIIPNPNPNALFGFGSEQQTPIFSYTPVTGVFQALIKYAGRYGSDSKQNEINSELDAYLAHGPVSIKVQGPTKDFIINGKTDKIIVDGLTTIIDGDTYRPQTFWGTQYYIFDLQVIQ